MAKHKFASISLTVRDRVISSKFSTHGVSKECTLGNFQIIFPSPKMAAILNFRIFAKNGKTQIFFYLLNRARYSDFVEIFDPLSNFCQFASISLTMRDRAILSKFSKNFPLPSPQVILNFRIFAQNGKTQICLNRAK